MKPLNSQKNQIKLRSKFNFVEILAPPTTVATGRAGWPKTLSKALSSASINFPAHEGKYFARPVLQMLVNQPFSFAKVEGEFDIKATVKGGGLSGQAGALKHGISKALSLYEPTLRPLLKNAGFITRDSRVVERKKYGKPKARRSFQFSKR